MYIKTTVMPYLIMMYYFFTFIVFNATFSNISAISWRPVLVVEEAGVPGQATGKLYYLQLRVECTMLIFALLVCNKNVVLVKLIAHGRTTFMMYAQRQNI
jgi:hypothetical protein